jgi:hypothetical protein
MRRLVDRLVEGIRGTLTATSTGASPQLELTYTDPFVAFPGSVCVSTATGLTPARRAATDMTTDRIKHSEGTRATSS